MKVLHITEPRCAGRELKIVPVICPVRNTCQRHQQIELDRQLGIEGKHIKVLNLPYVPGQPCHYRLRT